MIKKAIGQAWMYLGMVISSVCFFAIMLAFHLFDREYKAVRRQ